MVDKDHQNEGRKIKFEDWFGSKSSTSKPNLFDGSNSDAESSEDETALKKKFDKSFAVDKFSK